MIRVAVTRAVVVGSPRMRAASQRDPGSARSKRACVPRSRVPIYRVVLRKDRTVSVPVAGTRIDAPARAAAVAHAILKDSPYESLLAILISNTGDVVGATIIATTSSVGAISSSIRGVFTSAIAHGAAAVILAHNHPSGNPEPSADDLAFFRKAREASEILGIPVTDSLVVTRDPARWSSMGCA